MSGSYCKSLYSFSGDQHQQGLTFEVGEIIKIVQPLPGGWWEGELDGVRGWFPASYVQVLEVSLNVHSQINKCCNANSETNGNKINTFSPSPFEFGVACNTQ